MKKNFYYFSFLLIFISLSKVFADTDPQSFLKGQKLSFRENKGQIADKGKARKDIFFEAQGNGVKVYFTAKGLIYNYIQHEEIWFNKPASKIEQDKIRKEHPENIKHKSRAYGLQLLFEGSNPNVKIRSEEETGEEANFYLAHCPDGVIGVKSFKKIIYENIYPNIDLIFYSADQGMKYDFVVKPGGKVEDIKLKYKDVKKLKLLADGSLEIKNPLGKLTENKPFTYQGADKKEICSNYHLKGKTVSFEVEGYNKTKDLVIDPSIVWASYYGGAGYDWGSDIKTDAVGNIYMSGSTDAQNLSMNGFQKKSGGGITDAFIIKFNSSGEKIWSSYYGGNDSDDGNALSIDKLGNVYLAITTKSRFGITSKQDTWLPGAEYAFIVKFDQTGKRIWANYFGGDNVTIAKDIVVDYDDNIYLGGYTSSETGISVNGFQNTIGSKTPSYDAFIAKLSPTGDIIWSSYYGGKKDDEGWSLTIDKNNNVFLAGSTFSKDNISFKGFKDASMNKNNKDTSGLAFRDAF